MCHWKLPRPPPLPSRPELRSSRGPNALPEDQNVSFSGGWSTADVFGVRGIKDGVRVSVHFTAEAGIEVTAGIGAECSLSLSFYADGMAGPIPVTAGIKEGDLSASAAVGGELNSGGSIEVTAGGHTIGAPPAMLVIPDVRFWPSRTSPSPRSTLSRPPRASRSTSTAEVEWAAPREPDVKRQEYWPRLYGATRVLRVERKIGQFSAEGELLHWHLSTPQTPTLFSTPLGGNFCASSGSGGGGSGGGSRGRRWFGRRGRTSSSSRARRFRACGWTGATAIGGGSFFSCALQVAVALTVGAAGAMASWRGVPDQLRGPEPVTGIASAVKLGVQASSARVHVLPGGA